MVTHTRRLAAAVAAVGAITILSFAVACDKVPLLAPTGSVISLFPAAPSVPLNSSIEIVATVIENGVSGTTGASGATGTTTTTRAGAGTPVQNGTVVSFTTTIGSIEPREARTSNGEVRVKFISSGQSGTAKITAYSGGASATLENLLVGTAAAKRITVTATNQTLPSSGGSTEVVARVEDDAGSALPGVPVTFTTTAGTVSPTSTTTDASGIARTTLTSTTAADVTATSGAQTGKVTVGVGARSGLNITASPSSTTSGIPVIFTVTTTGASTTTPGQVVTNAVLDFGDGRSTTLGTVSATRTEPHVYTRPGTYTATVTARDSSGNIDTASTTVIISSLPVTLTAAPATTGPGSPVTYTVGGVTGAQVDHYEWTYDDGTTKTTTSPQDTHAWSSRGTHTARVVVIAVGGGTLGTAEAVVNITGA